jgi:hypothetical protein
MLEKLYKTNDILRRMRDNYKGPPVFTGQAENIGTVFGGICSFTNLMTESQNKNYSTELL